MPPELDFVIIGAQKSGTTTLHEVLSHHPQITMPVGKEWPFFSLPEDKRPEWDAFCRDALPDCAPGSKVGKATPQYLPDPAAAAALHARFPDAKIIAILRDPVERTYSHYRMCRRRNRTELDFSECVDEWLGATQLEEARQAYHAAGENDVHLCLAWSEYDRMLSTYYDLFPERNILILFMDDLEKNPGTTFRNILEFLDLAADWEHPSMGARFHAGGTKRKVNQSRLRKIPLVGAMARRLYRAMPRRWRFRYEMWNIKPEADSARARYPEVSARLAEHFRPDVEALARHTGIRPKWTI